MKTIEIVSFSGCPMGEKVYQELVAVCSASAIEVSKTMLSTVDEAHEYGLFGTPTVKINRKYFQEENCLEKGLYCRLFDTKEGRRLYPDINEIVHCCLEGSFVRQEGGTPSPVDFSPVLLISRQCAFTKAAKNLWSRIGDELGVFPQVIDIDEQPGAAEAYSAVGVPCLVTSPSRNTYGIHFSHEEARHILSAGRAV